MNKQISMLKQSGKPIIQTKGIGTLSRKTQIVCKVDRERATRLKQTAKYIQWTIVFEPLTTRIGELFAHTITQEKIWLSCNNPETKQSSIRGQ